MPSAAKNVAVSSIFFRDKTNYRVIAALLGADAHRK
jgi:hypothetical protein